ncbi:MAG: sigma-70 family RNA polymerase sigma factor [Frankiaceae bacterium]
MTASAERLGQWDEQLLAVAGPVRRVAAARLADPHAVDDVVQETLVRLLAARDRLDASALLPYAIVTARNLIHEHGRSLDRHRRHAHRVLDTREPDRPEDIVLQQEEQAAIAAALDNLPESDRRMLLAHEVEKVDTAALAAADGTTPGGVAAQLARARAKLRVEYVLALRRAELPTVRCRPVLLAFSAGDRRRQRSLEAGRHLLGCTACAAASPPLLDRRRALAGLAPWMWGPALLAALQRRVREHAASSAAAGAVAAAAVAAVIVAVVHGGPAPARTATPQRPTAAPVASAPAGPAIPRLTVAGRALQLSPQGSLSRYVGLPVRANGVLVLAVPADEGFWIGSDTRSRVWVQMRTQGESGPTIRPGQRVSFTGDMVRTSPGFAAAAGVRASEGAAQLLAQGAHIRAASSVVTISPH